jgi:hypothetical protein
MAWTAAEAEGRTLKRGETARERSSGKIPNEALIADPRAFFAKQFG